MVHVVVEKMPEIEKNSILERMVEPERVIMFRVPWVDDNGKVFTYDKENFEEMI